VALNTGTLQSDRVLGYARQKRNDKLECYNAVDYRLVSIVSTQFVVERGYIFQVAPCTVYRNSKPLEILDLATTVGDS